MKTLAERYRFFKEHAGYVVGQSAVCAMRLARAEARAESLGLEVRWEDEEEAWDGDCAAPAIHVQAWVPDPSGTSRYDTLASLGGIGLESWGDPYVRVVAAELFEQALDEIDSQNERTAICMAESLAARATYASV